MIKAVLFDLDNTLYAYAPCNAAGQQAAYRFLAKQLHSSVARVEWAVRVARHQIHCELHTQAASHSRLLYYLRATELITDSTQPLLAQRAERIFWKAYFAQMKLWPELRTVIRSLKKRGIMIALVSDLTTDIQISKIQRLNLTRYIDVLVTSEEVGVEKPDPASLRLAVRKLGFKPRQVVMIGDSIERDQVAAKRFGCYFILVKQGRISSTMLNQLYASL